MLANSPPNHVAYFAGDGGARETLAALAAVLPGITADAVGFSGNALENLFNSRSIGLVCTGTSDSDAGSEFELKAHQMAVNRNIPVIQVEDYPGNFRPRFDLPCSLLVADGDFSRDLASRRWGTRMPPCLSIAAPRYDRLRQSAQDLSGSPANEVLWVGQPETADALLTLERCLPHLEKLGQGLLFRAHPRDAGYAAGAYEKVLRTNRIEVRDVSNSAWTECLRLSPKIVITQFSSAAYEAAFHGIPSVHVLYPDAGGARLYEKKGYWIPPLCMTGASMLITQVGTEEQALGLALFDPVTRERMKFAFKANYCHAISSASTVVHHLYNLGLIKGFPEPPAS